MECRLPSKREEIKHNPETTDATETVCSWRTLVWRQAACSRKYLRGRIKTFCHLTYLSPTLHCKFQELGSHSLKVASLDFYTSLHPHPPLLKAFSVLWSRYGPHLWMHSFSKVLDPCTQPPRFFLLIYLFALSPRSERLEQARILKKGTGWFNFWKEPEIARAKSGEYSGCSINRMPLSSRYVCVLRALWGAALSWCNWIRDRRRVRAIDWLCRRTFSNTEVV